MSLDQVRVRRAASLDDVLEFKRWLGERRPWLAFDTETSGLDWWRGRLRLFQFGDRDTGWAFAWDDWAGVAKEVLRDYDDAPLVGHNMKFDAHWTRRAGGVTLDWSRVHDTQVMVSLLDGGRPSGLKQAAGRHVDPRAARGEKLLKDGMAQAGWGWDTVPVDFAPYWGYAGMDVVLTARLAEAIYPRVLAEYGDLYDLERGVQSVLFDMEERGALIDPEYTRSKSRQLERELHDLQEWCQGAHGVSIGSPQQLVERLLELGWEPTKQTDKGAWSTDGVTLTLLAQHPDPTLARLADRALRARKIRKTRSAYLEKFLHLADAENRLHASIRQLGARTGRMSVAEPSLQNLTRGPEVRDCFVASEGRTLVMIDFDQIEMRLLYHYCRDPRLHDAIMSGDLHTTTARMVYGDPTIDKKDPRRQPAKSSGFAKVYGAGLEQFAATAGIPVDEARRFMELYSQAFPGVDPFLGRVQAVGRQRLQAEGEAWVKTAGGRRQVASPDKLYTLTNYLIQGTAADVLKQALVRLDQAGLAEYAILPVHDEIVFDVPLELADEVAREAAALMEVPAEVYGVPLTVGVDQYTRWGSKYRPAGEEHAVVEDDPLELDELGLEE